MSHQFTPSTIDKILAEVRSIASASDFGKFVAQRTAEQTRALRGNYRFSDGLTHFFPEDSDASTIDALMDKISDLAPLLLPREKVEEDKEHTWLACIRDCAFKNQAFTNPNHPRHVDVNCRMADVFISSFKMEPESQGSNAKRTSPEDQAAKDDAMCFAFVVRILDQLLPVQHYSEPPCIIGASDGLIDFLMQGLSSKHCTLKEYYQHGGTPPRAQAENMLVQAIAQSASPGKFIAKLALTGYLMSSFHTKFFGRHSISPPSLGDAEGFRMLFRSLYIIRKTRCCSSLPEFLEKILRYIPSFPVEVLNSPLNLPDQNGVLIEDTMLSIASQGTHYCEQEGHWKLCQQLVSFGANVNGLVADPSDLTKKIVSRRDGKTPAMLACATGHHVIVDLILNDEDLDLTLKDNEGKSVAHYLLRRFESKEKHLKDLYKRDPALFVQHVTFADLDFAVRNGLHESVGFLLNLKNVSFEVTQLQELCNFCFRVFLGSRSIGKANQQSSYMRCETKEINDRDRLERGASVPCGDCLKSFAARTCFQELTWKLYDLGFKFPTMSFAGRRDRD